jgi:hypothetical protein
VLRSWSCKELHHFGGAGAATQCSSGFKPNIQHRWIIKNVTNNKILLLFPFTFLITSIIQKSYKKVSPIINVSLFSKSWLAIYCSRVGAGAGGA